MEGTGPQIILRGSDGVQRGKTYTCKVAAFNGLWGTDSTASNGVLVPGTPQMLTRPSFTGIVALTSPVPQTLTGTRATWNSFGFTIDDTRYQWQYADDTFFVGPDVQLAPLPVDDTYTLDYRITAPGLAGKFLRLGMAVKNQFGWSDWAYSLPTASDQVTAQPVLTAETPPTVADVNVPYAGYTFAADGFRMTYTQSSGGLTGLPAGMSINASSGLLSGTPTQVGTFTYRIKASNDSGDDTTPVLTLTVSDGVPAQMVITRQPVAGMPSRTQLPTQPVVQVRDDSGLNIYTPQTVTVTANGVGAVLGGTTSVSTGNTGTGTYANLTLGGVVGTNYTLTFTSGAASATSQNLQVTPGVATNLR
ncbi:MAG: hypothetical protein B7C55_11230, partial [Actinomycetales bacterium mxb001]